MSYFNQFPTITYQNSKIRNISKRVGFARKLLNQLELFERIRLQDGDTIESIAYDWYYNSQHAWLVMNTNNIIDPIYDWLLTQPQLDRMVNAKYDNPNAIAYYVYEGNKFRTVQDLFPILPSNDLVSVHTHNSHEDAENEKKRYINVIRPEFVNRVLEEFRIKISNG